MQSTFRQSHRLLATTLTLGLFSSAMLSLSLPVHAEDTPAVGPVLKGTVIQTKQHDNSPTINPNDIKEVAPGTTLDMVV